MKKRALLIVAVMLLITAVASVAGAVPSDPCAKDINHPLCTDPPPDPSTTTTTTTEAPPEFWTCQARVDNGAVWDLGEWNGAAYVAGLASCTDILSQHLDETDWTVRWNGATQRGTVKGLKLVLEEEVHNNVFAEQVFTTEAGFWCPTLAGNVDNLVFVAMSHNGDKWISFEVTVIPGHQGPCG